MGTIQIPTGEITTIQYYEEVLDTSEILNLSFIKEMNLRSDAVYLDVKNLSYDELSLVFKNSSNKLRELGYNLIVVEVDRSQAGFLLSTQSWSLASVCTALRDTVFLVKKKYQTSNLELLVDLEYPNESLLMVVDNVEVGRIAYDTVFPRRLNGKLNENELAIIRSYENPSNSLHLNFITVYEQYRGTGCFKKAMSLFEEIAYSRGFNSVNLFAEYSLCDMYEAIGYAPVHNFKQLNSRLMVKPLREHL